jgi:hypothetical protein
MKIKIKIALLVSLAIALSCSPLGQYKADVRGWEDDIQQLEQLDRTHNYPAESILFVGSSSIRLWSTIEQDMAPYPVIQRGYGGAKFSDVAWYAERLIYPHRFRALILFVANDIAGSPRDKSPKEVASLFSRVVKTVRARYPDTPVFYIEVTPTPSRWPVWPQASRANRLIRRLCGSEPHLHFIATSDHFLDNNGLPRAELFRDDRLHLNRDGYRLWSRIIKASLDRVLQPRGQG